MLGNCTAEVKWGSVGSVGQSGQSGAGQAVAARSTPMAVD